MTDDATVETRIDDTVDTDDLVLRMCNPPEDEPVHLDGKKVGALTVLVPTPDYDEDGGTMWLCRCACGRYVKVAYRLLVNRNVKSCGCLTRDNPSADTSHVGVDLSGAWRGMLHVIRPENPMLLDSYVCRCNCGNVITVSAKQLLSKSVFSCGCLERSLQPDGPDLRYCTHHPIKAAWRSMHHRVSEKCLNRDYYTGVSIAPEWDDFDAFFDWSMSHGWKPGLCLVRKDPYKDFSPSNCFWGTTYDVAQNRRHRRTREQITIDRRKAMGEAEE